jgi:hypothetical protein
MHNYKALKSASKVSVQKVKVVDRAKIDEVKYKDGDDMPDGAEIGNIKVHAESEISHEELQVVCKSFNSQTGEAQDDSVRAYSLSEVKREIDRCKADVVRIEAHQAELEQLETDLKAL